MLLTTHGFVVVAVAADPLGGAIFVDMGIKFTLQAFSGFQLPLIQPTLRYQAGAAEALVLAVV